MPGGDDTTSDDDLLAEQRAFYRWDAEAFDDWLTGLVAEDNDDPSAVAYRLGRDRIAAVFAERAPLGRVLEVAAGTGRLAELYLAHAGSVTLLDASPESLAIAARRLPSPGRVTFVAGDAFVWPATGKTFDTIVFSAWLHHVPHSRFDEFWDAVASALAPGGDVIFDFPDARVAPPGRTEVESEPTEDYSMYVPVDGVSLRPPRSALAGGPQPLGRPGARRPPRRARLDDGLPLGPGLFGNVVWASARRRS